jgi:type III secretion protein Y
MLDLMRSRALWLAGNQSEAKRLFSKFLEHRERSGS